jgi:hypothetical protein
VVINPRRRGDQQTFLAVAGNDHFSFAPSRQDGVEAVQPQIVFGLFFSVATHTGGLEERQNILVKRNVLLIRNGRKFADIYFADVPFVGRRILGRGRKTGQQQAESGQSDCRSHFHLGETMTNCPLNARKR